MALAVFVEAALLTSLLTIMLRNRLPENPAVLIWAAGLLAALSLAVAVAGPWPMVRRLGLHGALAGGALVFLLPFLWLLGTTFKYNSEIFVFPPHWIPRLPRAVTRSPYVVVPRSPARPTVVGAARWRGLEPELCRILWAHAKVHLPARELTLVNRSAARQAVGNLLLRHCISVTPQSLWRTNTGVMNVARQMVTRRMARRAWARVFRGLALAHIRVEALDRKVYAVPSTLVHWHWRGPAQLHIGRQTMIRYRFNRRDQAAVMADFPLPPKVKTLLGVRFALREDRSWQHLGITLEAGGRRYVNEDAFCLGAKTWRAMILKIHHLDPSNQRSQGVWPLVRRRGGGGAYNRPGWVRLKLTLARSSPLAAAFYKYTNTYREAWYGDRHWMDYLRNSALLVVLNVLMTLVSCSMAAYAFARLQWPGRDTLFAVLLGTMMLPGAVTMIPVFVIFKSIGWYNTLLPLWAPAALGNAFFIFLLRQFMRGIPRELEEAALLDGCGWVGIYWRIVLPLMKPALAAVAIFTFLGSWNDFMGPLIYLISAKLYPLSMGLFTFQNQHSSQFGMLMAASTMMILPVVAIFFLAQRYFIQGVTLTGIKG